MRGREPDLPDKLYFKIGEVADLVGVKPHVLRYWEREFSVVRPTKAKSNHRLYRRKDVETLLEIRRLLHGERFTIEGARKHLRNAARGGDVEPSAGGEEAGPEAPVRPAPRQPELPLVDRSYRSLLARVREEIESLCRMLR